MERAWTVLDEWVVHGLRCVIAEPREVSDADRVLVGAVEIPGDHPWIGLSTEHPLLPGGEWWWAWRSVGNVATEAIWLCYSAPASATIEGVSARLQTLALCVRASELPGLTWQELMPFLASGSPMVCEYAIERLAARVSETAGVKGRSEIGWPTEHWRVRTLTESVYELARDAAGAWWMRAWNIPHVTSRSVPPGWWAITPPTPWPPIVGAPLSFRAPEVLRFDDPARLPGGGKTTSPVMEAVPLLVAGESQQPDDAGP